MDFGIKGKVALVTGGSRGLGRQMALSLAGEGVDVAICSRTEATLAKTAEEIRALGVRCEYVVADASDVAAVEAVHAETVEKLGPVDILINNVGGSGSKTNYPVTMTQNPIGEWTDENVDTFPLETVKDVFSRNLFGGYRLTQLVLPHMKEQRWGRIITLASIWGREYGSNVAYMSAKAAVIAATKHAAVSLAKYGVTFNSIAPGTIAHEGSMWDRFKKENPPETVEGFLAKYFPRGEFGYPEPVGDLAAFLASDRSGMITGACIPVDGGQGHSLI
ncbi:MAG: SDR family NAD(P)-dependent oxidoreductase [Chloroflexi bacterium]|nr:SDR family NAD(P)-dependent oxidoreductase [Chloroflexota bacterium]